MSSLVRTRSLRKPAGPTALHPPRERPGDPSPDPNRNASPSRLPTKPTSRPTSSARTTATTTTTGLARSASVRLNRPGSSSSNTSSSAAAAPTIPKRSVSLGKKTAPASNAQGATAVPPARKDTRRYPPLSSVTRPSSMVLRPTSAGSAASAPTANRRTTPTHARANSTAALGTIPASSTSRRPTTQPAAALQDRKSRSRPPSRDSASSAAPAAPGTPRQRTVPADKQAPPTTPAAATDKTPRLRAFNPLQQRLSPGKPSSPRPPSPFKPPAAVAAAAETARQQAALLQLHLLHRDADLVVAQWHASAKVKLGARFRGLRDAHSALAEREAAAVEADNVEALQRWAAGGGARGCPPLDERVRALDAAMSGVWAMSEPGGKYARAVRRFERWFERVMDLEEARDSGTIGLLVGGGRHHGSIGGSGGVEEALFVPEMDPAWAEDCASMARKLEGWQCQLDDAGGDDDLRLVDSDGKTTTTTLGRMLDGARSLVAGMLAELAAMEEIRQAALAREEDWIEAMNRDDDEDDMSRRAGAVWRAL
ncbi:hypothetical protein ISF_05057 [Cordyceps fumosorosea ARSEF 2679]|uniref:Uncharacterized protein n=1 Tax=Cordyceps fumosorosea (strain ARSEF 2679) TaxID=1081104 RepID=A0A167W0G3_CORFA|nr:hypothetical protein ISF_05057 [Cordyceps fumosorosea ARSEF 2679]OAA63181.1 hypothetical protein ISF_05057 [Cordyceps fumosorosea ARSEF 2679]